MTTAREIMPVKCSGCAYRPGTEANLDELTQMTATLCVQAGEPFYCHANAIEDKLPSDQKRICLGHFEAMFARGDVSPWKAAVAHEALVIMEQALDGAIAPNDEVTARLLRAGTIAGKRR
jgi:hypothetical protein